MSALLCKYLMSVCVSQIKTLKHLLLGHNELTAIPEQLGVQQVIYLTQW